MLSVLIIGYALFVNPATGDEQMGKAIFATPAECAHALNEHHVIDTDNGPYYMTKAECHGVYVDPTGHIIGTSGDAA
jgi:uncharacterized protein YgiB involved in biofilm formation